MTTASQTGLDGVVAAATRLSRVDGAAGQLTIGGYAVEDLAPQASFEEVAHLRMVRPIARCQGIG